MKIKSLAANQTELTTANGTTVFFSYSTPVAACMCDGTGYIRTEEHYSPTTSRHINKWLDGVKARIVPQAVLDSLT